MSLDNDRKDLITPQDLGLHEAPSGADRRAFLMRSAAIAAAAVMTGCTTEEKKATVAAATAPAVRGKFVGGPRRGEEVERTGNDGHRRVLQSRTRTFQLPHNRADAHHIRLLSAVHEASGRSVGKSDRDEGASVRKSQRDRQGPRDRASRSRRRHRQRTGDSRAGVP